MGYGIVEYLAKCLIGYLQRLNALHTFEAYRCVEVLEAEHFHYFVCHLNDVALNDVLLQQITFVPAESANLKFNTCKEFLWLLGKQKQCGIFKLALIVQ